MTPVLVDTSVLTRLGQPVVEASEAARPSSSLRRCRLSDLEFLRGANGGAIASARQALEASEAVPLDDADFDRALDVLERLAAGGAHRGIPPVDLLVAALAERAGLTVLHYDADFDRIAAVTGQPAEWVVSRGSAD